MTDFIKLGEYAKMLNAQTDRIEKRATLIQHVDGVKVLKIETLGPQGLRLSGEVNTSENIIFNTINLMPFKL